MSKYYRTEEMEDGKGFKCYSCGALLVGGIKGNNYRIHLRCKRCKAEIDITMQQPLSKEAIENIQGHND